MRNRMPSISSTNIGQTWFVSVLLFLVFSGCLPKKAILDNQNHRYESEAAGIAITFPPQWRLSESDGVLFIAEFNPSGTPLLRLTATEEKLIPSLEDYLKLEPLTPVSRRAFKLSQNQLSHFQAVSSGKREVLGETWGESVWLARREGVPKVFHTFTIPVQLDLIQLHFEIPAPLYEGQKQNIDPVLEGVSRLPRPAPSSEEYIRAYRGMGETYKSREMWSDAIASFQNALSKAPNNTELHLLLGESYSKSGETPRALESFLTATRLSPQNARAYEGLADLYFAQGSTDAGISAAKRSLNLNPDNVRLYTKLGETYLKQGQTEESIHTFRKLLRRKPDSAEGHLGLGKGYLTTDLYEQAILEFEQALKLNPQLNEPHCLLERAYTQLSSTAEAEREKALCKQPAR